MSCEICGRGSCTRSFHSLNEQERYDSQRNECPHQTPYRWPCELCDSEAQSNAAPQDSVGEAHGTRDGNSPEISPPAGAAPDAGDLVERHPTYGSLRELIDEIQQTMLDGYWPRIGQMGALYWFADTITALQRKVEAAETIAHRAEHRANQAESERDALRKDGERLNAIQNNMWFVEPQYQRQNPTYKVGKVGMSEEGMTLRAAIDAAMQAKEK